MILKAALEEVAGDSGFVHYKGKSLPSVDSSLSENIVPYFAVSHHFHSIAFP